MNVTFTFMTWLALALALTLPVSKASAQPPETETAAEAGEPEEGDVEAPPTDSVGAESLPEAEEVEEADSSETPDDPAGPETGEPAGDETASVETGPVIEMPVEAEAEEARDVRSRDDVRGLQQTRFDRAEEGDTVLGGYGELHYNLSFPEGGDSEAELDLHRLVVFLAHQLGESARFYAEIEVEHALVGDGLPGQVGVEQAFVDWLVGGDALGLRAGIVLVPMGIINQWHEPPIFHGVERPMVDRVVIPTTWREGGVGVFGEPMEGLRYEAYVVGGLDPSGFSAGSGIRGGRQAVAEARADGLALTGRVELEPTLGVVAGVSAYFSLAGPNASLQRLAGTMPDGTPILERMEPDVPVVGAAVDGRLKRSGFEARAVGAVFSLGDTDTLAQAVDEDGLSLGLEPGSLVLGVYGEVGYDVLSLVDTDHALVPFLRLEWYDPTFSHEDDALQGSRRTTEWVAGLTYRPVDNLAFKGNFIVRDRRTGSDENRLDLGVGWVF
jgi:hypothetical protein